MDLEEDVDDPMEIDDDAVPVTPIIERRSDEFELPEVQDSKTEENILEKSSGNLSEKSSSIPQKATKNVPQKPSKGILQKPSKSITKKSSAKLPETPKSSKSKEAEVVVLDDDDDDEPSSQKSSGVLKKLSQSEEIIDLVDTPRSNRCLNTNCIGKTNTFICAPDFCLSYYRVKRSKNETEEICKDCYDQAIQDNDKLATSLKDGKLLFEVDFPIINETLQIDDSDEESDENHDMEYISEENIKFITENIDDILKKTISDLNLEDHMAKERLFLQKEAEKCEASCADLTSDVQKVRSLLDGIQINLYNQFRPDIHHLQGITIIDDPSMNGSTVVLKTANNDSPRKSTRQHKPVNYVDFLDDAGNSNSPKVLTPPSENPGESPVEMPKDLPTVATLDKPPPKVGELYYITREGNSQASWIRARLLMIIQPGVVYKGCQYPMANYKLVELKQQKERVVTGTNIAYMTSCKSRLTVGTRVISVFKEASTNGEEKKNRSDPYYAGVVGETPVESNKFRYLIFFDIGYSQYVHHSGINLVLGASANVWEDMPTDSRPFIKKYLESQDRPMVKLTKHQTVRVEYAGKWRLCTITDVDCSLVQVNFEALNRTEWIYRGSTRLSPMFREEQAATNRHTGVRASRKIGHMESATVVQYTRNNDFVQITNESPPGVRAVARKSTTRPNAQAPPPNIVPFLPPVNNTPINVNGPTSKIMYFTPRDQSVIKREYKPHECTPACKVYLTHNFIKLRGHNPLSKPLLCGWARLTIKDRGKKEIVYKAPCGRLIRNISEIHYYLRQTNSEMTVDLFDFNHLVRCLAEFSVECVPDPRDLSKGLEQVPIPVMNGFNSEILDFCNYSIKRVPMEGVDMNLDPEFLCGCDCDDDCIDKTKCACWKLTLEGVKYIGKDVDPISVGYIYRRLQEQVITGIYECNSRCKCGPTCLNRVVQNPLSLKLQVYRTHNRGWGIRSLNDIPQGTFICIYAGTLHTEQMANEDGKQYGDEYFAELDYIETVEKYKEDYEEEALEEEEYQKNPLPEEEPEEDVYSRNVAGRGRGKRPNYSDDNDFTPGHASIIRPVGGDNEGIRTRLRKRKEDDQQQESTEKEKKFKDFKVKKEIIDTPIKEKSTPDSLANKIDTVTISDDEDEGREVLSFNPQTNTDLDDRASKYMSVREMFGPDEKDNIYIMDAKNAGNIGRFLNHSCAPNVFVQNVFVDTHDLRYPWVAFFSSQFIRAGTELTWNYNYDIGSVPGRVLYCYCAALECKGRLL